jgi:pyruvate dehydrogenase (quinone)
MRALEGMPKYHEVQDLAYLSYAAYADLVGLEGITLDDPADIASTWDRALAADHPVVIDAIVDAAVPPLPPHVDPGKGIAVARSILRRDPEAGAVVRQGTRDKLQEFRPST